MATLHTQDGSRKNYFIKLAVNKNSDRNFIFIINANRKDAKINSNIKVNLLKKKL